MRASATCVDTTALSPLMVRGLTTPEKRMYSVPWLMAICFSPTTFRLPLARTSATVTVMVPVKVFFAEAPPLPSKSLLPLASRSAFWLPISPLSIFGTVANASVLLPSRVALADELLLALTFSCRVMVRISPTLRGCLSSNSG
ncbi:hypothetical protein SODG_006791 [Sodalis praecaptivus]|nr:hypothetical protein NVIRENTERO_01335 [Sodalis praecaptivus]